MANRDFSKPFSGASGELAFPGVMARGAKGIGVRRVQEWLTYHGQRPVIDSEFGPATERYVKVFQSTAVLPQTGIVDEATWAALTAPLRRAMQPIDATGKTLNEMVVAYAKQHLAEHPIEIGGPNDGPWVRSYMLGNGGKPWQWCSGWVCLILAQAYRAKGWATLPFTPSFGVPEITRSAKAKGRFLPDGPPVPGDVFVIPTAAGSWSHTGIVLAWDGGPKFTSAEGNGLPLNAPILTPAGWRRIGDLAVGDPVCGPDSDVGAVTAVYPQGVRPTFTIQFSDGSSVVADDQHRWSVLVGMGEHKRPMLLTTAALKSRVESKDRVFLPTIRPVRLPASDLPLDPYLLGLLLGDGGLTRADKKGGAIRFTSKDRELIDAVSLSLPDDNQLKHVSVSDYRITGPYVIGAIRSLDLAGAGSFTKFIPSKYLWASADQRIALLQGLLDTDGTIDSSGRIGYCTVSPQLAKDVQFLVQSLGGKVAILLKTGVTYTSPTQKTPKAARDAYMLGNIRFPHGNGIVPFRLERKVARLNTNPDRHMMGWAVKSVTPSEPEETVCICVSTPSRLYLTGHFIPTHNTNAEGSADGTVARSVLRNPARCDFIRAGS